MGDAMTSASKSEWQKYYDFLDSLRKGGATNMFGAAPYLRNAFEELDRPTATEVLSSWMEEFDQ